jgi:serine protease Do
MKRNAVAWAAMVVSLAALVGSRSYTKPATATQDIPAEGQKVAADLSKAFHAVAEFVKPSVVQINVEKSGGGIRINPGDGDGPGREVDPKEMEEMLRRFFGPNGGQGFRIEPQQYIATGTGSGFVYDDKGHILTNNHVVEGADTITVTFFDGVKAEAKLVGNFPDADVAVIQVPKFKKDDYRAVRVGDCDDLKVGEWVLAFGSPFGLSQTVTAGIISATQREDMQINRYESFIQTDASINPGNSGGPLVNMKGEVVGINSAIATTTRANAGVGFTIPIDMATRLADKLIAKGKIEPLLMGIKVSPLDRGLARQLGLDEKLEGVVVTDVGPGTPAAKAGLEVGDVITTYDGEPVHNLSGLQYLVTTSDLGQSYEVKYLRDGKEHATQVAPASMDQVARIMLPEREPKVAEAPEPPSPEVETDGFGLAVEPLDAALSKKYGWQDQKSGLVVTAVAPKSPAEAAGIEVGDLITRFVRDREIRPADDAEAYARLAEGSDEIAVYVEDVRHKLPGEFKTLHKAEAGARK